MILMTFLSASCKKQDSFLNSKPNEALTTISSISDISNLLNNETIFNDQVVPGLGEVTTDDYFVPDANYVGRLTTTEQNAYIFAKNIFSETDQDNDWNYCYGQVYQANVVLDALPKISGSKDDIEAAQARALFYRSFAFYNLVQQYSMPYDSTSSKTDLGIVLRLSSDLNDKSNRTTVQACYEQILDDLKKSIHFLPKRTIFPSQPSLGAGYALLARIYLNLYNYNEAFNYSDSSLRINGQLTDFNTLIPAPGSYKLTKYSTSVYPLVEDIYHCTINLPGPLSIGSYFVDSNLVQLYSANDLRATFFLLPSGPGYKFKGSYEFKNSSGNLYAGLATDEMYLIRSECEARNGKISDALSDLNLLLINRYVSGTYQPYTTANTNSPLSLILKERRKELLFRGLRWTDERRLNKDVNTSITVRRIINGNNYTLPPNDPRYAIQIAFTETTISGIPNNSR